MKRFLLGGTALVTAALAGGGVAVGIGSVVDGGSTTTVVREVAAAAADPSARFVGNGEGQTIADLYEAAAPGVVQVASTQVEPSAFFGLQQASALGSGFVIDKAGHIVTNYHVVQDADEVEVNFSGNDGVKAKVVGSDPSTDIAVLQVDVPARSLTPLPLGDSDTVQVGDAVVAIGNPFGLERSVTAGIVSALQREITAPNGFEIDRVIQTDAAINRGNSGGPLLNPSGEVIGVNSQIATSGASEGNVGIGFAVPINTVRSVVSQLIEHGRVEHAWLGVLVQTIDGKLTETFRLPVDEGVLIARVQEGSPAEEAGLEGGGTRVVVDGESYVLGGDVITSVDGDAVANAEELRDAVTAKKPGDELVLEVHRGKETETVTVRLGRQPATPGG